MTTEQFSNEFDTLLNSYARTIPFGSEHSPYDIVLDEYEKSVLLTHAQRDFVESMYSGRNSYGISFEEKEELREALDALVKTITPEQVDEDSLPEHLKNLHEGNKIFMFYYLPKTLLYIIFEEVKFSSYISGCNAGASALVVPTTHDEVWHRMKNPFRGPSKNRVLRLNASDNIVELISDYPIGSYLLRYVDEPKPIILTDLPDDLKINGLSTKTECELPAFTHQLILENAVKKALQAKSMGYSSQSSDKS